MNKNQVYEPINNKLYLGNAFQPIYNIKTNKIFGYESLLRSKNQLNPEELFRYAKKLKRLYELDITSIYKGISSYKQMTREKDSPPCLNVNVYPSTIMNPEFKHFMESMIQSISFPSEKIVLEINEKEKVNIPELSVELLHLKELGFQIALDDVGKEYSTLTLAEELEPNIIKLDRSFSRNLADNSAKQRILESIVSNYSKRFSIVLEGIEMKADLEIARSIGIHYAQGYYLGRPAYHLESEELEVY